ncbi:protein SULFUR DEFICIENCY-INDUCED 1 [Citrus sinensis]|uniref:Protein SULFUR DEFICIENCY-INDUCED 1 n=1 Tax=Citrus sinensis TaxID=2711 RepID=A0ACB8MH48_CITSI|nr:protein SULFUR DEFICIENCY-INDUCED 1 [Citrus sinensis]
MEMGSNNKKIFSSKKEDLFHVIHKVPAGDGPYVRAKHAQLVQKDPEAAIVLFWKAINAGDRVDSALKDMAVVMKQLDRSEEAIEAIKSFRGLCSKQSQESLDNVLIDLYKKCGKVEEQIEMLKRKLRLIYQGEAFNGKPTKTARSHGKKFQVSVRQETSRLLGNLAWAYMQKTNFMAAEVVYQKAQMIDPDANKACNLGLCLIKRTRYNEARSVLEDVLYGRIPGCEDGRTRKRAEELLLELESKQPPPDLSDLLGLNLEDEFVNGLEEMVRKYVDETRRGEQISDSRVPRTGVFRKSLVRGGTRAEVSRSSTSTSSARPISRKRHKVIPARGREARRPGRRQLARHAPQPENLGTTATLSPEPWRNTQNLTEPRQPRFPQNRGVTRKISQNHDSHAFPRTVA